MGNLVYVVLHGVPWCVLLPGRGKVLEFGKGVNLCRPAAKLSGSLQNTKCCLEVDPSKAQCREQDGDTLG